MLKKDYEFELSNEVSVGTQYRYIYPDRENQKYTSMYTKFKEGLQSKIEIRWTFYDKEEYMKLKKEAEELGFKYKNTSKAYTGTGSVYAREKDVVTLLMETINGKTIYVVSYTDIPENFLK